MCLSAVYLSLCVAQIVHLAGDRPPSVVVQWAKTQYVGPRNLSLNEHIHVATQRSADYIIIGAGPAGLQTGYFLDRAEADYLILERADDAGAFYERFPRHRSLISVNKVNTGIDNPETNLRWDWNSLLSDDPALRLTEYTDSYFPCADDLVRYLHDYAKACDLKVEFGTDIASINRSEAGFELVSSSGEQFSCRRLIVATGYGAEHVPDVPGIEHAESYGTMELNADDYKNQRVLIVGKGNSALETANHLVGSAAVIHLCSPERQELAWQTHYVGDMRAVNAGFYDTYLLKIQNASLDAEVTAITPSGDGGFDVDLAYTFAEGDTTRIPYDRILTCTGFTIDKTPFQGDAVPELKFSGKLPALTETWESTNVPDMFFAGTLMHSRDFRKTMSGFIHGFRHNIAFLVQLLMASDSGTEIPFSNGRKRRPRLCDPRSFQHVARDVPPARIPR